MKKILCFLLAFQMIVGTAAISMPVLAEEKESNQSIIERVIEDTEYSHDYDDTIFEGGATYLLDDTFSGSASAVFDGQQRQSGWDVDVRGGQMFGYMFWPFRLNDYNDKEQLKMSHALMPHRTGDLTFETGFKFIQDPSTGFYYTITGEGGTAMELRTIDNSLAYIDSDGVSHEIAKYSAGKVIYLKAIFNMENKSSKFYVDGQYVMDIPFKDKVASIDNIELGTGKEQITFLDLIYVKFYINYLVNDKFMNAQIGSISDNWDVEATNKNAVSIITDNGNNYPDTVSLSVKDDSILEQVKLSTDFTPQTRKVLASAALKMPQKSEGIKMQLKNGDDVVSTITVAKDGFKAADGTMLFEDYYENAWYTFKIVADVESQTADLYINHILKAEKIPFETAAESIDNICFTTKFNAKNEFVLDDVMVYEKIPLPEGYPTQPKVAESKDYEVAMLSYPLWREGIHYGWEKITPYADERKPYLGWYTEGQTEVSDWEIKWMLEHGIDYQIFPQPRVQNSTYEPIKNLGRGAALEMGFFEAEYKMDFAILWSAISAESLGGLDDFKNNIVPYWVDTYFRNPNYKKINGVPIMYIYNTSNAVNYLGGIENYEEAMAYLKSEVKRKCGYDDIIIGCDISAGGNSREISKENGYYEYRYGWGAITGPDTEALIKGHEEYYEDGDKFIFSVPFGYNSVPWGVYPWSEPNTSEGLGEVFSWVKEKSAELKKQGHEFANIVTLTCWNEIGEGHYYIPATGNGFGYLNEVRNAFTDEGRLDLEEESMPSEVSIARMGVLYPTSRGALKQYTDPPKTVVTEDQMYVMQRWDFSNKEDFEQWAIEDHIDVLEQKGEGIEGHAYGIDPKFFTEEIALDTAKIRAVRIRMWIEGGEQAQIFYKTTNDTNMGVQGKRFENNNIDGSTTYKDYLCEPADASKLTGTMTGLRIDPDNKTGNFGVAWIEVLGSHVPRYHVIINEQEPTMTAEVKMIDYRMYVPAYTLLERLDFDTTFDLKTKTFTAERDGNKMVTKAGSNIAEFNGKEITLDGAPIYEEGHFYIPVRSYFNAFGATVDWDENSTTVNIVTADKIGKEIYKASDRTPFEYEFEIDRDTESWERGPMSETPMIWAKDGKLQFTIVGNDPLIYSPAMALKAEEYKYCAIRMKNNTQSKMALLFFITQTNRSYGGGKRYDIAIKGAEDGFVEYIVDLTKNSLYEGVISKWRFDAADISGGSPIGSTEIDYIRFLKTLDGYEFAENSVFAN